LLERWRAAAAAAAAADVEHVRCGEIHTPSGKPDEHEQDVTVGHHRLRVTG
jgi:hypothetical protein